MSTAFVGTERFELIRRLGEGGFGIVYEAFDRKRSTRVALKLLRQAEGTPLYRFKREFRALADISHPNLVALDELLTDGWHWFFTMELVRGVPVVAYARPSTDPASTTGTRIRRAHGELDEARLRCALPQLADALNTIHRAGIVHCDIKPSNVLVTPEGRVVVLDFGLVSERPVGSSDDEPSVDSSSKDLVVLGTPAYMAPEQATPEQVTPAADWYSVGVMLYEMLTGQLPFSGSNLEVIEAKQNGRPRPPTELNRQAPKNLAALSMKLLDPNPARRPSGDAVLQCVGRAPVRLTADSGVASIREMLLGRESHLQSLGDAFETMVRGETVVAFVSGLSGMGKTALIRHFLHDQRAKEPGLLALTSRCYERESMPYKAMDPLIDALARHLQRLRDIEVARLLPRDAAILARLFPVLLGVDEVRRAPEPTLATLDTLTIRERAAGALRELLFALAIRAPLVLVIDDVQWGDVDSASILQEVLRPPYPPPLLLIAAYRSEDAGEARLLRTLSKSIRGASRPRVVDIDVGALTHQDARRLATKLTAGRGEAAERADAIARESGGNAFFVYELAQHAVTVGGPTRLDAVVLDRVSALPDASRRLLIAIALSAQAIPADVARIAAGLDAEHDREPLHVLSAARLVRGRTDEPNVEPYHDRIREAVVSELTGAELEGWHRRLAVAWEASGVARPETLVAHYQGAGDDAKTSDYAAAAAEKAREALAFDRAAEFYEVLVRLERDPAKQRQWFVKLGEALANAGRGHGAAAAFLKALDGATADEAIELERSAAAELLRAGYLDEANEVLQRLLPKVGVRPPGSDLQAFISLLAYRLLLAIRGTAFRERPESQVAPEELRRIDVLASISAPLSLSSLIQGNALLVQAVWHALRAGEPRRVVIGLSGLTALEGIGGTRTERRTRRLVQQSQTLAAQLHDQWAIGRTVLAEGIFLKTSGQWKRGVERLERAIEIFATCTGVRWETETAQLLIHDAVYWMGEWNRLARELPARRLAAEQRGDLYAATHVAARLSPIVHLAADRVDHARSEAESGLAHWTKSHFHLQHRFAVCTGIDIDLYTGDPVAASRRLTAAWPHLRRILFVFQNARVEMRFYHARIALAMAARGDVASLRQADADARRLDRERAPWASALAQLVRATIEQGRGKTDAAIAALESAEASLRRCEMNHYAAAAQYRRGNLMGGDAGQALVDAALAWMRDQRIVNPKRLFDLLTPGPW